MLGEFLDDLDLTIITSALNFDFAKDKESPDEKVGLSRLGNDDLFKNLGATFILFFIIFLSIILLIILIICVG
jgi:hypothetical protein